MWRIAYTVCKKTIHLVRRNILLKKYGASIYVQPLPPWQLCSLPLLQRQPKQQQPIRLQAEMQPGLLVPKRIKFPFMQFQLFNLLPSPLIGIFLVLYQFNHSVSTVRVTPTAMFLRHYWNGHYTQELYLGNLLPLLPYPPSRKNHSWSCSASQSLYVFSSTNSTPLHYMSLLSFQDSFAFVSKGRLPLLNLFTSLF